MAQLLAKIADMLQKLVDSENGRYIDWTLVHQEGNFLFIAAPQI